MAKKLKQPPSELEKRIRELLEYKYPATISLEVKRYSRN